MSSPAPSRPYHHGDLQAALVTAGLGLLATRDADGLSLREVARAVGVSANAVYRHFPDKRALMEALAAAGLRMLAHAQRSAAEAAGGGVLGFNATGREYVRFALANPALFRLIFAHPSRKNLLAEPAAEIPDAMAFLRANAAQLAPPGSDGSIIALQAWSLAHGLAMLVLDGQIDAVSVDIEAFFAGWPNCIGGPETPEWPA